MGNPWEIHVKSMGNPWKNDDYWLVVSNMNFNFPSYMGIIIPTD
jgi:hypothetical protein